MIALHSGPRIFFALLTRSYLLKTLTFERTQNKPFTNVHKQIEVITFYLLKFPNRKNILRLEHGIDKA